MKTHVSVIVPTYRRDSSLEAAIKSLMGQTYEHVEIVVVDDNADPVWNRKVQQIISRYPQVKYICNTCNCGSAQSRNAGIYEAEGEFVTFLDDDDIYLPDKIGHQVKQMESQNADFSLTDLNLYDEKDTLIDPRIRSYLLDADPLHLRKYHLMYHMTGTDTMMFRRDYLLKIGGFPPIDVGDEFYLMDEAIKAGGSFLYIPGCHVKAYVHTGNGGLSSGQRKIDGENSLFEYKKQFFHQVGSKATRYIKMRHYAVLAFAYLRMRRYVPCVTQGLKAFFCAPIACIQLIRGSVF